MNRLDHKRMNQVIRKKRVRATVKGTTDRPRLSVSVSNRHVSAQIINDETGKTLVAATTVGNKSATGSLREQSALIGTEIAKKAAKAKITKVVFDRNGRSYEQRLNALATAARENGLEF